ncbi:MAG: aromatic acid exporter family protein [Bacillaceae bacterium]
MYQIGYRTLKTGLATGLAILISESAGLENYISAGIIAILCVQVTVKRSLQAAMSRFFCCMIVMLFGTFLFEGIGYYPIVITILLLFYIPVTVRLKIQEGIVTSSVIMLHLYKSKHIDLDLLINEFWLVVIGIGAALSINMFMPNLDKQLQHYQRLIEDGFKNILTDISDTMTGTKETFEQKHIQEVATLITKAKNIALRQLENNPLRERDYYYQYFKMREKQLDILTHIAHILMHIDGKHEHVRWVASLIEQTGKIVSPKGTAIITLYEIDQMRMLFRGMELPKTREEFEERAHLLQIIDELERYLQLKNKFSKQRQTSGEH